MEVARLSVIENTSEDLVYLLQDFYGQNFKKDFLTAETGFSIQIGPTVGLGFELCPNDEDIEQSLAVKKIAEDRK